jgi:hypothetical protein
MRKQNSATHQTQSCFASYVFDIQSEEKKISSRKGIVDSSFREGCGSRACASSNNAFDASCVKTRAQNSREFEHAHAFLRFLKPGSINVYASRIHTDFFLPEKMSFSLIANTRKNKEFAQTEKQAAKDFFSREKKICKLISGLLRWAIERQSDQKRPLLASQEP